MVFDPPSNIGEFHSLVEGGDFPAASVHIMMISDDDCILLAKRLDEHGRTALAVLAGKAQTHTHILAMVGVYSIGLYYEALTTRDNDGETPLDIALRSGACAEIIGLLSLTPEEARSLDEEEMFRGGGEH